MYNEVNDCWATVHEKRKRRRLPIWGPKPFPARTPTQRMVFSSSMCIVGKVLMILTITTWIGKRWVHRCLEFVLHSTRRLLFATVLGSVFFAASSFFRPPPLAVFSLAISAILHISDHFRNHRRENKERFRCGMFTGSTNEARCPLKNKIMVLV